MEYEIHCKYCQRFLAIANGTLIAQIKCSNSSCKKMNNIKVVTGSSTPDQIKYQFATIETGDNNE